MTRSFSMMFLALGFVAAMTQAQMLPPSGSGQASSLPPGGEARATFIRVCSGCHAPEIVAYQRLDTEGWNTIVYQMADQGAVASDKELDDIVEYLSKSFPNAE